MSLPSRFSSSLALFSLVVVLTGCKTIYSDVYSPEPNRFVPPPKKSSIELVPPPPAPGDTNPLQPQGSSAPVVQPPVPVAPMGDPAMPAIPGL